MKLACILFLIFISVSCGYGSNYNGMNTGLGVVPNIAQLSPASVTAGGAWFCSNRRRHELRYGSIGVLEFNLSQRNLSDWTTNHDHYFRGGHCQSR